MFSRMVRDLAFKGPRHTLRESGGLEASVAANGYEGSLFPAVGTGSPAPLAGRVALVCHGVLRPYTGGRQNTTESGGRQDSGNSAVGRLASAYRDCGEAALDDVAGEYAFALWDTDRRRLLLYTDPFAQRTMYYALHPGGTLLAFASETRLLRRLQWVGNDLDAHNVVDLLLARDWSAGHTPFRNIKMVPAGHCLQWTCDARGAAPVLRRYWGPRFPATGVRSRAEFLLAFEHRFRESVAQRMAPTGEGGTTILMSGGFNSTAVAGVAAALSRAPASTSAPVNTVSATFGTLPCDESERIAIARAYTGVPGVSIQALEYGLTVASIESQVHDADFPLFNLQHSLLHAELDAAEASGSTTILMGQGGDEIADDTAYARDLLARRGWHRFIQVSRLAAAIRGRSLTREALSLARASAPATLKTLWRGLRHNTTWRRLDPETLWLEPEFHAPLAQEAERRYRELGNRGQKSTISEGGQSQWQRAMWELLQRPVVQFGQRGHIADIARRGLSYGAPFSGAPAVRTAARYLCGRTAANIRHWTVQTLDQHGTGGVYAGRTDQGLLESRVSVVWYPFPDANCPGPDRGMALHGRAVAFGAVRLQAFGARYPGRV